VWGELGLAGPSGIAVDAHGYVYVADHRRNRVVKLSPSGRALGAWYGVEGENPHVFGNIGGLTVDTKGNLWVVDTGSQSDPFARIIEMSPTGDLLAMWPYSYGAAIPSDIAVDAQGSVYVTSPNARQIVKYASTGRVLAVWR
jgi:streptogramin lyase